MARPLYDRTTAKPLRLEAVGPLGGQRVGVGWRRPWGFVAAGAAALTAAGAIALSAGPGASPQPASVQAVSRPAEGVRKIQVVKPPAEVAAAPPRPEPQAPAVPATSPTPPRPAEVAQTPRDDAPTLLASIGPLPDQPRAPEAGAVAEPAPKGAVATTSAAPLDCVPGGLRTVLADVAARFGPVTVVSTNRVNADNHTPGTIRHSFHAACKAVDFKTAGNLNEVLAFLRSRPEVGGINSYRNGLIHIDLNERSAGLRPRARPVVAE